MGAKPQGRQHLSPLPQLSCCGLQAVPLVRTPLVHWWLTQLQPPGRIVQARVQTIAGGVGWSVVARQLPQQPSVG